MVTSFKYVIALLFAYSGMLNMKSCNNNGSKKLNSPPVENTMNSGSLDKIKLPPGFKISEYARVNHARSMCISPGGTLFVGNRDGDKVYAVIDENKDGKADKVYVVAKDLNTPNGVAFKDGDLYIAGISVIYKLNNIESSLSTPPAPVIVFDKYPTDKAHGWKFIAFGPDGKLYVPVGAPCNNCDDQNPVFASITRMNAHGTGMEIFAKGIRNTVGFAWHPVSNELWFTDNGRDNMGDDIPADELNKAPGAGMHFGFPYCHQGNILDPQFGKGKICSNYTPPIKNLGAHVAALGMRFYTGKMFPKSYKNAIFIAEHGSWNRTIPVGYRVVVAMMDDSGNVKDVVPFAEGWLQNEREVLGRPVDVQVMPDGALLVSDDYSGMIYRITYQE